jgi:peroxiredoxin Q/BCP
MVELRKRKAPAEASAPPPKKPNSIKGAASRVKAAVLGRKGATATPSSAVSVGSTISLDGFGGEVETSDGKKTTLKQLVDESAGGVVLFTYPKASTPGCKFSTIS